MNTKLIENMKKKKKKGFTLIELIIVIAILAILAAIAIPKFGTVKQDANVASDKANAKNISLAVAKGIAEDKIKPTAGTYALDSLPAFSGTGTVNINTLVDGIDVNTKGKTSGYTSSTFRVVIGSDSNITVTMGPDAASAVEVYPDSGNAYKAK